MHDTDKPSLQQELAEAQANNIDWTEESTEPATVPTTTPPPPEPSISETVSTEEKQNPDNVETPKRKRSNKTKRTSTVTSPTISKKSKTKKLTKQQLDMNEFLANNLQLCDAVDIQPINDEAIAAVVVKSCQDRVLRLLSEHANQSKRKGGRRPKVTEERTKMETE